MCVPPFPPLISTASEIQSLAHVLKQERILAVDTEFIWESTFFPEMALIQIATHEASWVIDVQAFLVDKRKKSGALCYCPGIQPLLDILQNPNILKVFHAAQGDQESLHGTFGILASPIFDTSIAAGLSGYGDHLGLGKLLQLVLKISLPKGHSRTNWFLRPLPQQLLEYAHNDVRYLVRLAKTLLTQLESLNRKHWALRISAELEHKDSYEMQVEEMTNKIAHSQSSLNDAQYVILFELMRWREEKVRELNIPRRWLAEDRTLLHLAQTRPQTLEDLKAFRGIHKVELERNATTLLDILTQDITQNTLEGDIRPNRFFSNASIHPSETRLLDLLRTYLHILADNAHIAMRYLISKKQLFPLLRHSFQNPTELVQAGILSKEACDIIGTDLIAFLSGKRSLKIINHQVHIAD